MSEADLLSAILLAHSRGDSRLFRLNAGRAWQGKIIAQTEKRLVLSPYYSIKLGPEGISDLIGWSAGARFTAIEGKISPNRPTDAQQRFIELVLRHGGRAGIAHSVEEAEQILRLE
jgi:VRR-NUC domain